MGVTGTAQREARQRRGQPPAGRRTADLWSLGLVVTGPHLASSWSPPARWRGAARVVTRLGRPGGRGSPPHRAPGAAVTAEVASPTRTVVVR